MLQAADLLNPLFPKAHKLVSVKIYIFQSKLSLLKLVCGFLFFAPRKSWTMQ